MRAIPVPDGVAEASNGRRVILGPMDPTGETRPCEYVVVRSDEPPALCDYYALITLEDGDLEALAETGRMWLRLCGAEVPWAIHAVRPGEGGAP